MKSWAFLRTAWMSFTCLTRSGAERLVMTSLKVLAALVSGSPLPESESLEWAKSDMLAQRPGHPTAAR